MHDLYVIYKDSGFEVYQVEDCKIVPGSGVSFITVPGGEIIVLGYPNLKTALRLSERLESIHECLAPLDRAHTIKLYCKQKRV